VAAHPGHLAVGRELGGQIQELLAEGPLLGEEPRVHHVLEHLAQRLEHQAQHEGSAGEKPDG